VSATFAPGRFMKFYPLLRIVRFNYWFG